MLDQGEYQPKGLARGWLGVSLIAWHTEQLNSFTHVSNKHYTSHKTMLTSKEASSWAGHASPFESWTLYALTAFDSLELES